MSACPRTWVNPGGARWSWQKSAWKNGTSIRNTAEVRWPWRFQPADWLISVMRRGHGEAESQWKEREWVKNGPTVETAVLMSHVLNGEKHPHAHQYDERPSPKPYMEKSQFLVFFLSFFVVFLICLFAVQEKKQLKTNKMIKNKNNSRFTINVGGDELQRFGWDSAPGVHGSGPARSRLSVEMPALKAPVGGCGSGSGSGCYVLWAAGVSLLSQLPGRKQVNVNSRKLRKQPASVRGQY